MKKLILILSMLCLLLFGAWGCPEKTEQSAKTVEEKTTTNVETAQAGTVQSTEVAKEKAKKVIEELQVTPQGSMEETKGSE